MNKIFWLKLKLHPHQREEIFLKRKKIGVSLIFYKILSKTSSYNYWGRLLITWIKQKLVFLFQAHDNQAEGKKKCQKSLKECQWYCLPPAACEVLKDSSDEWVYLRKKKKASKILLLCSVTQIKRDVGGNQVICVQDI